MPGYQIKQENVPITGVADLFIRSLLDRQQFSDPLGAALRQGISSATWPLFGLLWPSGAQLAARMALRPVLAGERILELGCGLALPSLVGHRRGADITASDCHPLTRGFLQANLVLNQLLPMKYRHGHWSQPGSLKQEDGAPAIDMVRGRFDLIIGSDLLYERDHAALLAGFIAHHANPAAQVLIADPGRGYVSPFSALMLAQGYVRTAQPMPMAASVGMPASRGQLFSFVRGPA